MTLERPRDASIEALWQETRGRLLAWVARRTASAQDAEDVVQDVFLRMHLALDRGDPIERLDAWMFQVARNAVVDRYRRAASRTPPEEPPPPPDDDADELRASLAACLAPFVERLPAPYAEAVRWADLDGLTQAVAARRAGVSVSGMKSRVQRGRAQLRALLDECCRFDLDCRGTVVGYESRGRCGCDGE